eukprot:7882067-Lingulodinium_polyedra.AAC.1
MKWCAATQAASTPASPKQHPSSTQASPTRKQHRSGTEASPNKQHQADAEAVFKQHSSSIQPAPKQ